MGRPSGGGFFPGTNITRTPEYFPGATAGGVVYICSARMQRVKSCIYIKKGDNAHTITNFNVNGYQYFTFYVMVPTPHFLFPGKCISPLCVISLLLNENLTLLLKCFYFSNWTCLYVCQCKENDEWELIIITFHEVIVRMLSIHTPTLTSMWVTHAHNKKNHCH